MPLFKKIKLGIRSKIYAASLVIALMLLLSGAMAFFEFGRMSRNISDFISNSILSVDLTRNLLNTSERYHSDLFRQIGGDGLLAQPETIPADEFEEGMERLYTVLASDNERNMADSVRYAYSAYMQVAQEIESVWLRPQDGISTGSRPYTPSCAVISSVFRILRRVRLLTATTACRTVITVPLCRVS